MNDRITTPLSKFKTVSNNLECPPGYDAAFRYYLTSHSEGLSAAKADANLLEQLYADNIPEKFFYTIDKIVKIFGCKALPEIMKKAAPLLTENSSPSQSYMGALMIVHSLVWGTVLYKNEAEALKTAIRGFEYWLEHTGKSAPWAMSLFYGRYAETIDNTKEKTAYLTKAADIYKDLSLKAANQIQLHNAIAGFFFVEKRLERIKDYLNILEAHLKEHGPLSDIIEEPSEPFTVMVRYPFRRNTKGSFELLKVYMPFFETKEMKMAVTYHLLPVLYLSGVDDDVPCGVVFRYCVYNKYEKDKDIRWIDLAMALVKKYWDGYDKDRLFLEAEASFLKGDEDRARALLTDYYLKDFDSDYTVRIHSYSGGHESIKMMRDFNRLIDEIRFDIYKNKVQEQ